MSPTRRDFLKYTGAASLLIASDLVGELIAQSPKGNPMTSMFKGLADVALGETAARGCFGGYACHTTTRRSASAKGSGARRTPRMTENTAVLAPTPSASVITATSANPGARPSSGNA